MKIIDFGLATPIDQNRRMAPYTTYMPGTKQYMAPEIIVRPVNERLTPDLSEADLSKVDSFALGVVLINMLTGAYLFESCLTAEYRNLMNDKSFLVETLRQKVPQMDEAELMDLATFLQALLHEEPSQRLSMAGILEKNVITTDWLHKAKYKTNTEEEIGAEMHQRIFSSESFRRVLTGPHLA